MPSYEWKCDKCGKHIDLYLKHIISDKEKIIKCECGGNATLITFAPLNIRFCEKGKYIQDRGFDNEKPEWNFALKKELEEKQQNVKV